MARRPVTEVAPLASPDGIEEDDQVVASEETLVIPIGGEDSDDQVGGEQADGTTESLLPPPVYEPIDREEWLRQHNAAAGVDDPLFGPAHPDSTSEILRRPEKPARPLRKPVVMRRRSKPRIRRVTRIVRHVDTWSVFKVALVFNVFLLVVLLTSGVLLWQVARATGTIDNVERFFESFGWRSFKLNGGEIYHSAWIGWIFVAIGLTGIAVLAATLFNLITDLVGGIRVTVLEEEVRTRDERIRPLTPPADEPATAAPQAEPVLDEPVLTEPALAEVDRDVENEVEGPLGPR